MQHEASLLLAFVAFQTLCVIGRAQCRGHQRLCLTAREQG